MQATDGVFVCGTYNWFHSDSFLTDCWQLFSEFTFIGWFSIVIDFVTGAGRVSDDGWMARYVVVIRWSLACIGSNDRYGVVVVAMHDVWPIFDMFGFDCVIYFPDAVAFLPAITFCPITFGWTHILFMDITVRWVVCCTNLVFAFMVLLLLLLLFLCNENVAKHVWETFTIRFTWNCLNWSPLAYLLWVMILLWALDNCDLDCGPALVAMVTVCGCCCCTIFALCTLYAVLVWFFGWIVIGLDIVLIAVLVIVLTTLALPCLICAAVAFVDPLTPPIVWFTNLIVCCWFAFVLFKLFTFMLVLLIAIELGFWIWITFPIWLVWCWAIGVVVRVMVVGWWIFFS